MKIKLAILEKDISYLQRIVSVFETKYSDKFEIYSFSDPEITMSILADSKIDVLIANDVFEINAAALPRRCGFAYLVDSPDVDTVNNQRTICKFQRAELIYKQILSVYSENAGNISGLKLDDNNTKLIAFASPSGGVGTSSMAASCSLYFASQGKKILYLNFEKFGSSDAFFKAEGQFDMSDIIFSLKSKMANLTLKLESCVKHDPRGVYFYSQSKIALDMLELNAEDISRLIAELKLSGTYEYIILDMDFSMDKGILDVYREAHSLVMVGDGSETSNIKIFRAYNAISTVEQKKDSPLTNRLSLIYNKFSNKTGQTLDIEIKNIGGAPRYEHATTEQIVTQLSAMDMFSKIV